MLLKFSTNKIWKYIDYSGGRQFLKKLWNYDFTNAKINIKLFWLKKLNEEKWFGSLICFLKILVLLSVHAYTKIGS